MNNYTIAASLEPRPVPLDRECVETLTQIIQGVVDFTDVAGLASGALGAGAGQPITNNTAAQALTIANEARNLASDVQAAQRERRSSTSRINFPTNGDIVLPIVWSPDMPSTLYEVRITLWGSGTLLGASDTPGWRVVAGSEALGSVSVNFANLKNGMSFTFVIEEL